MSRLAIVATVVVLVLVLVGAIGYYRFRPNGSHIQPSSTGTPNNDTQISNSTETSTNNTQTSTQGPILFLETKEGWSVSALWEYKGGGLVEILGTLGTYFRNIGDSGEVEFVFHPLIDHRRYQFVEGNLSTTIYLERGDRIGISYALKKGASPSGFLSLYGDMRFNVNDEGEKSLSADFFGAFLWNYDGSLKVDFGIEIETSSPLIELSTRFSTQRIFDSDVGSYRVEMDVAGLSAAESVQFSYSFSGWSKNPSEIFWEHYANWSNWESASGDSGSTYWYDIPRDMWIDHVGEEVECKTQITLAGGARFQRTAIGRIADDDTTGPSFTNTQSTGDIKYSYNGSYRIQITASDPSGIDEVWFRYRFSLWSGSGTWSNGTLYSGRSGSIYWYDIPRNVWHTLDHLGQTIYFEAWAVDADNDRPNDGSYSYSPTYTAGGIGLRVDGPLVSTLVRLVNTNNTNNYLELKSDGTFYLRENGEDYFGTWNIMYTWHPDVYPSEIELVGSNHIIIGRGVINGAMLIDPTGDVWAEVGAVP